MIKYYPILKKGNSEVKAFREEALNQKSNLGEEVLPIIEAHKIESRKLGKRF